MKQQKIKFTSTLFLLLIFCFSFPGAGMIFAKTGVEKKQVASSVPTIYPRSSWSSATYEKRTKKVWPAEYEDPEVIIIHHTATNYKSSTSKQIKKIYRYHSYTRKWGDIGYNYIIGKDGAIFEGRYGGNGVIGGHSYYKGTNYNKGSIGIAVLGNYENEHLSSEAKDSLQKLIGWLSSNNNISVKSSLKFFSKSLDNAVIGHRNVASTACPGKNIYKLMADIRNSSDSLASTYGNYAYQISGDGATYEIRDGKKISGSAKQPVIEISATQLAAYALEGGTRAGSFSANYPSGTIFGVSGSDQKGILENGILRPISIEAVLAANYNGANIVEISAEKWASYAAGAEAGFRSGAFVKDSGGNYYIISGDQKRKLNLSSAELESVDLGSAHEISESESAHYAEGETIDGAGVFPEGTIITKNFKTYFYVLAGGKKKKITKNVFRATFSREMAVNVSIKLLKKYKTKGNLSFRDGAAVNYGKKYYFIENGLRRQLSSKNFAVSIGYENITKAKRKEMAGIGKGAKVE